jgi:Cu(I)/Ag(I) efflux system periplasmic protein CusF
MRTLIRQLAIATLSAALPLAALAQPADGEVRKIDAAQGKVTLKHGEIKSLDMPPMTMVFTAAEPKLLEGLKVGQKVKFEAEKRGSVYTVVKITPAD